MLKNREKWMLVLLIVIFRNIENSLTEELLSGHLPYTKQDLRDSSQDEPDDAKNFWEEIMSEIKSMLKNKRRCQPKKYLCYTTFNIDKRMDDLENKELCSCDSRCVFYGECCPDYISRMPESSRKLIQGMMCGALDFWSNDTSEGLFMIGQCPSSQSGSLVDASCLLQVPESSYTYVLDVPVTSTATNLTYRNYYCALCHNDAEHLVNIHVTINCEKTQMTTNFTLDEFMKKIKYMPETRRFMNKSANCIFKVKEYEDVKAFAERHDGRLCKYPGAACSKSSQGDAKQSNCLRQIRTCDSTWQDSSDNDKCKAYSLKIFDKKKLVLYKNPHCARCNYVNLAETPFACKVPMAFFAVPPKQIPPYPPSFSILFKPNTKPKKCRRKNEVWNPLLEECTKILCEDHFYVKGGRCVRDLYEHVQNSSDPNVSCPKISLHSDNYIKLPNGSIKTFFDKHIYLPGEFQPYNDSIILVCAGNSLLYYDSFSRTHSYVTFGVLIVSIVCLALHIFLYLYLPSKKTWHERNLFCMCCSLFMAQVLFLTATTATKYYGFCVFLASFLHYCWLASFFWMSVMSFDIWRTFKSQLSRYYFSKSKVFKLYSLYAWGIPFLIVAMSLFFDFTRIAPKISPNYAQFRKRKLCWINKRKGLLCFFIIPVGIIILENVLFFVLTSYGIYKQTKEARFAKRTSQSMRRGTDPNSLSTAASRSHKNNTFIRKNQIRFALYMKLGILQGLTWVTGFTASFANLPISWYFFTIINGLQGAAIFLSFDLKMMTSSSILGRFSKKNSCTSELSKYTTKLTNSPHTLRITSTSSTPSQIRSTFAIRSAGKTRIRFSTMKLPFKTNFTKKLPGAIFSSHKKINDYEETCERWKETPIDLHPPDAASSVEDISPNLSPMPSNGKEEDSRIEIDLGDLSSTRSLYVNEGFVNCDNALHCQEVYETQVICVKAEVENHMNESNNGQSHSGMSSEA